MEGHEPRDRDIILMFLGYALLVMMSCWFGDCGGGGGGGGAEPPWLE